MNYYEGVNVDVLSMLPKEARTVVEIGCGAGRLTEVYRAINPTVRYLGVEFLQRLRNKRQLKWTI